jgi:uncharacterized glyoxalase superfamily protein PhnB
MAKLIRSAPYFPVADCGETSAYYEKIFGFKVEYIAGEPPEFAICSRDSLAVMLRRVSTPGLIKPVESQGGTWDAFFWVEDVVGLHAELAKAGANVVYGPLLQEVYNMDEFAVRDPDGHVLGFGQARQT